MTDQAGRSASVGTAPALWGFWIGAIGVVMLIVSLLWFTSLWWYGVAFIVVGIMLIAGGTAQAYQEDQRREEEAVVRLADYILTRGLTGLDAVFEDILREMELKAETLPSIKRRVYERIRAKSVLDEASVTADGARRLQAMAEALATESEVARAATLVQVAETRDGRIPTCRTPDGVFLKANETCHLYVQGVEVYEDKSVRQYSATGGSVSYRATKRSTVRSSHYQGQSYQVARLQSADNGLLLVTNERILFQGTTTTREGPLKSIVGVARYEDEWSGAKGLQIQRIGKSRREVFGADDLTVLVLHTLITALCDPSARPTSGRDQDTGRRDALSQGEESGSH
jgi:hypothetical protein